MDNGNLILPPFRAEDYNQEVHAQTYRCIAENTFGKIISRDVHVRAGTAEQIFFPITLFDGKSECNVHFDEISLEILLEYIFRRKN